MPGTKIKAYRDKKYPLFDTGDKKGCAYELSSAIMSFQVVGTNKPVVKLEFSGVDNHPPSVGEATDTRQDMSFEWFVKW